MDFSLTEEQQDVQKLAQQILTDHTDNERLKHIDQQADRFDETLWQQLAEAGLLGLAIEEACGGMGYGFETLCLLLEEVGRCVAPVPVIPVLVEAALIVQQFGSAEQKSRFLPGVAAGGELLTAALIEPDNEDSLRPGCLATRQQSGDWLLSGTKQCVLLADRAQRVLLAASSECGPVVLLLDPRTSGVSLERQRVTGGDTQFLMRFVDAAVTEADVIAVGETAQDLLRVQMQQSRAAICAMAVGLTDRMTRMTAEYTAQREQFGQLIATFQAVAHRAADCYIDVECLRLVTQQAVSQLDRGQDAAEAVQVAKIWCGDVSHRVSQAAQHLHGGIGVDRDYPLFRYCLQARQLELSLGTSAALNASVGEAIAEEYLRA